MYRPITKEEFFHPLMAHILPLISFEGRNGIVAGTCVLIAPNYALTAKHVMEYVFERFGFDVSRLGKKRNISLDIYAHQLSTGHTWYVSQSSSWIGTDIMLLRLTPRTESAKKYIPAQLAITVDPPKEDSEITAIGYPSSDIVIHRNDSEVTELDLTLNPTVSVGKVLEVYHSFRDMSLLRFPSFSVNACFAPGMSGGAVFNSQRELCGLVCAGLNEKNKDDTFFYSNAVSIWPSMIIPITLNTECNMLSGLIPNKPYKLIDFARQGIINVKGHERIDFFKHANGTDGIRLKRLG